MPEAYLTAYNLYAKGDLAAARSHLEAHLRGTPGDQPACFLLGVIDLEEGALQGGLNRLEAALKDFQPPAPLCHRIGRVLFEQKQYQRAAQWLGRALKIDPGLSASHYWLGNTLRLLGEAKAAEASFKEAIRLAPGQARAHVSLAYLYREEGLRNEAAEAMLGLAKITPDNIATMKKIGKFLADINRLDMAEKILTKILPEENENPEFLIRLGQIRQKLGLLEEAAQVYRRAIIRNPSAGPAYLGLADVKTYESPEETDAIILRQALDNDGVSRDGIICSHFALGKIHDDCRDYVHAFEHYQQANSLKAEETTFDREVFRALVQNIVNTFKHDVLNAFPKTPVPGPTPVFIIGMVRAGTTLVEDTLDIHPKVFGAGDLALVGKLAEGLGKRAGLSGAYPDYIPALDHASLQGAAHYYLKKVAAESAGEAFIVDSNPLNFMHLGLIAGLFPNARVIHCRRSPLDTILSIYFRYFPSRKITYAYDLEDICEVYLEYNRLMEYWAENLPLRIFDLDYEALVKFPEKVTQRLMASLDLQGEESPVPGEEILEQNNQHSYRVSIDRWKNYETHLEPVAAKLKKVGIL